MKQAGYSKRPRGRSFERHRQPQKNLNGDSAEPRTRSNPQQFVEKYLTLARDAASLGDPISAENYYQYADHYYRLAAANRLSRTSERHRDPKEREVGPSIDSQEKEVGPSIDSQEEETTLPVETHDDPLPSQ